MGTRVIACELSVKGINRTLRELAKYQKELADKAKRLEEKVAERIRENAQSGFNQAILEDILGSDARYASVDVTVTHSGAMTLVIANGEDAVWVEFGAGVKYNGSAGSSPHPKGAELGFTIGGYGKGFGKRKMWAFWEDGQIRKTFGTPAAMPLYSAVQAACREIEKIAKEVF